MWLRGVSFNSVANASGARGFFKEGYWYHYPWKVIGMSWGNSTFIAKTVTMEPRLFPERKLGNMKLKSDGITPAEFLPPCIVPNFRQGIVLNAVGLSNPGAVRMLSCGKWQQLREAFFISFMAVKETTSDRLDELREFVALLNRHLDEFAGHVGLELNYSCPNAKVEHSSLAQEIGEALDIAGALYIPLQIKLNALAPVQEVCEVAKHPACNAIVMGNTLPWGSMQDKIHWEKLFGNSVSPLMKLGGGGLSGPPLRPIHCQWIAEARDCGFDKPIWGCGGIDSVRAVKEYRNAGASGIQLGTVCMMRPWRMRSIISYANSVFR